MSDWLSKEELDGLTPDILAERIKAIVPLAAKHAQSAERERKPNDEVWAALRKSGIFYHFVPKKFGGLEFGIEDFLRIMLPLGEGCASTAWVATFCMEHNWILARFPEETQVEIFPKFPYIIAPGLIFPPATMTKTEGGYRVSGRLKWGTGIMHADWVIANGVVPGKDGAPPRGMSFIVPIKDCKMIDVWEVDGMAATGSNDVEFLDIFVPNNRIMETTVVDNTTPGQSVNRNPIYRAPKIPFLSLTAAIAPVGAALGAVGTFRDYMKSRIQRGGTASHAERPATQAHLGHAQVKAKTAEKLLYSAARTMAEYAKRDDEASIAERIALRMDISYAVELARSAIHELYEAAGSTAHFLDNPLQRAARDVSMMATHIVFDFEALTEQSGRVQLGMPPTTPLL